MKLRVFPVGTLSTIEAWMLPKMVSGARPWEPDSTVVDFKFRNKVHMKAYYERTFG